jgi:small GTP-binding protein
MKRKKNKLGKFQTKNKVQNVSTFYRLIFIGDSRVGKTQIINKYNNSLFQEEYLPTYCVDFQIKPIKINGKKVNIHCIDTLGSMDFTPNTGTIFIQKTDAFIYVFDLTSRESLYNLQDYINIIKTALTDSQKIISEKITYFVGNKCDLVMYRQVEENEGRLEANKYKAKYMEISAKTGINIDKLFNSIIQDITTRKDEISVNSNSIDSGGGGGSINSNANNDAEIINNNINNININVNQNLSNKDTNTNIININNNINRNNTITNNNSNKIFKNINNNIINTNINNNIKPTITTNINVNNNIINTNIENNINTNINNNVNTNTNLIENEKSGLNYDSSTYFLKSNYSVNNINNDNNNNDLIKNINNIPIENKGESTNEKIYPNIQNNENYLKKCYIF